MSTFADKATIRESEADRVFGWRCRVLMREEGMDPQHAARIAESPIDLHQAVAMLRAGCTPALLASIACD